VGKSSSQSWAGNSQKEREVREGVLRTRGGMNLGLGVEEMSESLLGVVGKEVG
jgi:hypothetical protein